MKSVLFAIILVFSVVKPGNGQKSDKSGLLGEVSSVFVADELRLGLIPAIQDCWAEVQAGKAGDGFWHDTFYEKLKPFHDQIMEIDAAVLKHAPARALNKIVNLTEFDRLQGATELADADSAVPWIEMVKVGWVKIQSLTLQVAWKYEWIFDYLFGEQFENEIDEEMEMIISEKERLYFAWNAVTDRGDAPEKYHLDINELTTFAKQVMEGVEEPKAKHDLFYGLKALLDIPDPTGESGTPSSSKEPCGINQTHAGTRASGHDLIPVYVLLHLLNAEFKFYIIRNVAKMYLCLHFQKCDFQSPAQLQKHLDEYYEFYFGGMVKAFVSDIKPSADDENETEDSNGKSSDSWRWRCDPENKVENLTFVRFYDFDTGFVAPEQDLSTTQSCRDTCDTFDHGYSQIPCPQLNYTCLGQEGDFDCLDKTRHAEDCPNPKTRVCPNGISCSTTPIKSAKVCMGNDKNRRLIKWIDTDSYKQVLGRSEIIKGTTCPKMSLIEMVVEERTERSEITKFEPQKCEVCICRCMEPMGNNSHRYIGLLPELTELEDGFVIVGARFTKVEKVIQIKIAVGKLVNGIIVQDTVHWVKQNSVTNINDPDQVFRLGSESRRLLLDDFTIPDGFALTGLRFKSIEIPVPTDYEKENKFEAPKSAYTTNTSSQSTLKWKFGFVQNELRLEAQVTAIDENGKLDASTSRWLFNGNTSLTRPSIALNSSDVPIYAKDPSLPMGPSNGYVKVQSTSLKKDAAQTPVPFFDAQELIEAANITYLTAIGLFLKSQPGYGGFVTFKFKSKPMQDPPPNPNYDLWHLIRKGKYPEYTKA